MKPPIFFAMPAQCDGGALPNTHLTYTQARCFIQAMVSGCALFSS